jgi:GntR family transcriptional regulator
MEIVLNRQGGASVRDQLVTQLELRILDGSLAPGQRLPSVRALARRLKVHANTVSAAYQDLEGAGHVRLRKGSGVFVRDAGARVPEDARGLDEIIRLTLHLAMRKGFAAAEIRAAVERWLHASPPDRVVVVDPVQQMGEVLVHELSAALGKSVSWCSLDDAARQPGLLLGALALVLPYHAEELRKRLPDAAVEILHLEMAAADRSAIAELPAGSIVLIVAHSQTLLPVATVVFRSLRGEELLIEACEEKDARRWRRLLPAADLVVTDALSALAVRKLRPKRMREMRTIPAATLGRLRTALEFVVPR